MRKIIIYSKKKILLPENILEGLKIRNTKIKNIIISKNNNYRLELYGYDGNLKYLQKNILTKDELLKVLRKCLSKIDKMVIGSIELYLEKTQKGGSKTNKLRTRKQLLKKCGLPNIIETSHCFADSTHHTCCMLGSRAREYADSSGNPIGSLSVKVQNRMKKKKTKNNLMPWCTCTGSKVCSYYTNKFGKDDGTHIKFIGNIDGKDEDSAISKLGLMVHRTSGIGE